MSNVGIVIVSHSPRVAEGAVPVIAIKRIFDRRFRLVEIRGTAIDEINVEPAIIIEVEE